MTGSTLLVVRTKLKAELGTSGTGDDTLLNQLIVNKQFWFCSKWDWAELEDRWDVVVAGGSQFVSFPTKDWQGTTATLRLDRPLAVQVFYNQIYSDLDYGIGEDEYNTWNPALNQQQDPIMNWMRVGADKTKFEVWPMPATQQTVRFIGQKAPTAFSATPADTDIVDLDDDLIALTVAAEFLLAQGSPAAGAKGQQARDLFLELRGNDPKTLSTFRIGKDMERGDRRSIVPLKIITVHG